MELDPDIDLQSVLALKTCVDKLRSALRAYLEATVALIDRQDAGGAASASKDIFQGRHKMEKRLRQELKSLNRYLKSAGASGTSTLEFEFAGSASNASKSSSYLR